MLMYSIYDILYMLLKFLWWHNNIWELLLITGHCHNLLFLLGLLGLFCKMSWKCSLLYDKLFDFALSYKVTIPTKFHATLGEDKRVHVKIPLGFKQCSSIGKFKVLCLQNTLQGLHQSPCTFWKLATVVYLTLFLTHDSSFVNLLCKKWKGYC